MAHLLKSLELNAFKSFAQKTTLEFTHGITAVVGPNGSGKSNVIDAIRWLLGERDAKHLRGGKGEDLIFAGTPKRPRAGLAQASLYFDNSTKFFNVPFSEVVVSRQVNRDGENRYYLNKAEVRLKDIQDFFASARLGSRGLTVVTQGNSDVFIRATPVERREMIEEILGLREYQLKRTEAERRLRSSEQNIEKVHALIEEIAPHLRSLKRQTSRWEKRGELEAELRALENQFFGSRMHEFVPALESVEQTLSSHAKEKIFLETEKKRKEDELKQVESGEPKERKELDDIKRRTVELLGTKNELQKQLGRIEAQIEIAAKSSVIGTKSMKDLVPFLRSAREKLEQAMSDPEALRHAVEELIAKIKEELEEKSEEKNDDRQELWKKELIKLETTLTDLDKELEALKTQEQKLGESHEKFYELFKDAIREVESAKEKLQKWEREQESRSLERERILMRKEELERQIVQAGREPKEFLTHHDNNNPSASSGQVENRMFRLRGELASMGEADEEVIKEARATEERHEFLGRELTDLEKARTDLRALIKELNEKISGEFKRAMVSINEEFGKFFELMFGGGTAKLKIQKPIAEKKTEPEDVESKKEEGLPSEASFDEAEEGIEISVNLPRKRTSSLEMLSGGERSLVGIAALFAMISVSPPPFLVLDEIDAPLDERNARRFGEMLREFAKQTQFIVVTHNRATMEAADVLYGVTLNDDGTSKVLSMKLEN